MYFNNDPVMGKRTQLRTDGKIDNAGLNGMGIKMDERGIAKLIPHKTKEAMGAASKAGTDFLKKTLKGVEAKRPTA